MNFRPIQHILLYMGTFTVAEAFFANIYGDYAYKTDYTHAEITEIGILKAVATFFEETPMNGNQSALGSLTGIADITAKKLYDQVYGGGSRSPKRLQEAIDQIIYFNNKVDLDHYYEAVWHFNGEQIEQGNKKLQDLRYDILTELNKQTPDFVLSREWIGQFLHIMQMFYSNTNWADDNGNNTYSVLGQPGGQLLQTAPPNMDTCTNCTQPCVMNYAPGIMKTYLTSGYKGGQDITKPYKDPSLVTNGKCSHGGPLDNTSTTIAAIGGINKESSKSGLGPHYYFHTMAAEAAIDHTLYFFNDNPSGIRHHIPTENFMRLMKIDSGHSLVFVIDNSGSMSSKLATIVTETRGIIQAASSGSNPPGQYVLASFSDPASTISVQTTNQPLTIINWIANFVPFGGDDCPEPSLTAIEQAAHASWTDSIIYVFTDSSPKDSHKEEAVNNLIEEKRLQIFFIVTGTCSLHDPSGLTYSNNVPFATDLQNGSRRFTPYDPIAVYRNLAAVSGGDVYVISENHNPNLATIFKESITAPEVLLMKNVFPGGPSTTKEIHIEIDSSITRFTLNIHAKNDAPRFNLYDYRGNLQYLDNKTATIYTVDDTFYSIVVESPGAGSWALKKNDINEWNVEVTGKSTVDFAVKFMQYNPDSHSFYEFRGKHLSGENMTVSVELNDKAVVKDISIISLLDVYGSEIAHYSLTPKESRHARAFYYTTIIIPYQPFKLAVMGILPNGKPFVRMHRDVITPVSARSSLMTQIGFPVERLSQISPSHLTGTGSGNNV